MNARALRMPAEWESHEATWLAWPVNEAHWGIPCHELQRVWVDVARALLGGEKVCVLVPDRDAAASVTAAFGGVAADLHLFEYSTDDIWIRDFGPLFVRTAPAVAQRVGGRGDPGDGEGASNDRDGRSTVATCWEYNGWGGRFAPWDRDAAAAGWIAAQVGAEVVRPGLVVEGGAIDVDGEGTLLTTRNALLDAARNPDHDAGGVEASLRRWLGAERVVWLDGCLDGDDTGGHIDNLARFVAPGRVVYATPHRDAPAAERDQLARLRGALRVAQDARDRCFELIELPLPRPLYQGDRRLAASYTNFYVGNRSVLVPTFSTPEDSRALALFEELFPGRAVVGINARDLLYGGGALHCMTQQQPI